MKKNLFLSLWIVAIALAFVLLPTPAWAADGTSPGIPIDEGSFPDENFCAFISECYDQDEDGYLSDEEIEAVQIMDCSNRDIQSLEGIGCFYSLWELDCGGNELMDIWPLTECYELQKLVIAGNAGVELSGMEELCMLEYLDCSGCGLSDLNVSAGESLKYLDCSNNQLVRLNTRDYPELEYLNCAGNKIAALDVQHNSKLRTLECGGNNIGLLEIVNSPCLEAVNCAESAELVTVHLENCTALESLCCSDCPNLEYLTLWDCTALTELYCARTAVVDLHLYTNTALITVDCFGNGQLEDLQVQECENLSHLDCSGTHLLTLDIRENPLLVTAVEHGTRTEDGAAVLFFWTDDADGRTSTLKHDIGANLVYNGAAESEAPGDSTEDETNPGNNEEPEMPDDPPEEQSSDNGIEDDGDSENTDKPDESKEEIGPVDEGNAGEDSGDEPDDPAPANSDLPDEDAEADAPGEGEDTDISPVGDTPEDEVGSLVEDAEDEATPYTPPAARPNVRPSIPDVVPEVSAAIILDDVPSEAYFAEAAAWAVKENIMPGLRSNTFDPDAVCTRADMVTYLWRAMGCPEPTITSLPFTDIPEKCSYYKALLWAVEHGIVAGVGGNRFDPDSIATRAQIVTVLFRAAGIVEVRATTGFTDIPPNVYYAGAVGWAYHVGITTGTGGGLFSPNIACNRAQMATFLFRHALGSWQSQ